MISNVVNELSNLILNERTYMYSNGKGNVTDLNMLIPRAVNRTACRIGLRNGSDPSGVVYIDDLMIFTRALTDSQILLTDSVQLTEPTSTAAASTTTTKKTITTTTNNKLASGSWDNTTKIWDIESNSCLRTLEDHSNIVYALQFLGNNTLASGSGDKTIKIWNIESGSCLQTLEGHTNSVRTLQLLEEL